MRDENKKKDINEVLKTTNKDAEVQGYAYCDSSKAKCLNDCSNNTPFLSNIN